MGQKPRKKNRGTPNKADINLDSFLSVLKAARAKDRSSDGGFQNKYQKQLEQTRNLISQYKRCDVAIALNVSELWPGNSGSPVKHIFTWGLLLGSKEDAPSALPIESYADFKLFVEKLYACWPEFAMLEDFLPESDWGQIKAKLGNKYVPIFYGCSVERIPDFIESFRITYAHIPQALAHMNLAIALQSSIITAIPDLLGKLSDDAKAGHVETPPEEFWVKCKEALLKVDFDIEPWRNLAGNALAVNFGGFDAPISWDKFGGAVMQGMALPYLALKTEDSWLPISVRNAPSVVIDHWGNKSGIEVTDKTHRRLAFFIAERFKSAILGPLKIQVGEKWIEDLPISSLISTNSGVQLICACDHESVSKLSKVASFIFDQVRSGAPIKFRLVNGPILISSSENDVSPRAEELKIIIAVTEGGTAIGMIDIPKKPTRLLPLTDILTIFDSLDDLSELDKFWAFVDADRNKLNPMSSGAADMFATFRDTHGVLVDGAVSPTLITLDPHWGTTWRFDALTKFWSMAPSYFPDGSQGWRLDLETAGVVGLYSRHHDAHAYSTEIGSCTAQTFMTLKSGRDAENSTLLDLFCQLIADCTSRCRELVSDIRLFQQPYILFYCMVDENDYVVGQEELQSVEDFKNVVTDVGVSKNAKDIFNIHVNTRAVLAGLNSAKDGSFEVRCLIEVLDACHREIGLELPEGFTERFIGIAAEQARYHLKVVYQRVDVPIYIKPVIPTPGDYKLARKQLAKEIMALGLEPGKYELADAKEKIDKASASFRKYLESRLAIFDKSQLVRVLIEQHDGLLATERNRIERAKMSLAHAVEYDRHAAIEAACKDYADVARHYRYLLEKTVSSSITGNAEVTDETIRELGALVNWYMVLTGASDVLHNGIDVGGIEIDRSFIPDVYYSGNHDERNSEFIRHSSNFRLGIGVKHDDAVEGASKDLLSDERMKVVFLEDTGFELESLLVVLMVLAQPVRNSLSKEPSLSYFSTAGKLVQVLTENIEGLELAEAVNIIDFLTLSESGILQLVEREIIEVEVPYWEHSKRTHRYAIRPLIRDGEVLRWGAETASRALNIWTATVRDGYLPADFRWRNVDPLIREIKADIERRLEYRTEEIFLRHTPYVIRGIDFYKRFPKESFDDVGDFDVFAYWPEANLVMIVECKYNKPPYTIKDGRRLRDTIFGRTEDDRRGQLIKMLRRREFLGKNRSQLLQLLNWQLSDSIENNNIELYVCRDLFFCMFNPPYPVPINFVRIDELDTWISQFINGTHDGASKV